MFATMQFISICALLGTFISTYLSVPSIYHVKVALVGMFFLVEGVFLVTLRSKLEEISTEYSYKNRLILKSLQDSLRKKITAFDRQVPVFIFLMALCMYLLGTDKTALHSNISYLMVGVALPASIYAYISCMTAIEKTFCLGEVVKTGIFSLHNKLGTRIDCLENKLVDLDVSLENFVNESREVPECHYT